MIVLLTIAYSEDASRKGGGGIKWDSVVDVHYENTDTPITTMTDIYTELINILG